MGRKSKKVEQRENRSQVELSPVQLKERIKLITQVIQKYPEMIAKGLAHSSDSTWLFGRLFLVGCITLQQKECAIRLDECVRKYRKIFGVAGAGAQDYGKVGRSSAEDLSGQQLKRAERAQRDYDRAMAILDKLPDPRIKQSIMIGLDKDILVYTPDHIAAGLTALINADF